MVPQNVGRRMPTKFQVVNIRTQQIMGSYTTAQRARNKRDQLDLQHGSYAFTVKAIYF